jgi:hypothetical protein
MLRRKVRQLTMALDEGFEPRSLGFGLLQFT